MQSASDGAGPLIMGISKLERLPISDRYGEVFFGEGSYGFHCKAFHLFELEVLAFSGVDCYLVIDF
jgi:hypothetical protein